MKSLLISFFILAVASCNSKTSKEALAPAEAAASEAKAANEEMEDCLTEYATITDVLGQEGRIVAVAETKMIAFGGSSRVNPCNLPDSFIAGQNVKFSGKVKQAPDGVRVMGTPFVLTLIEKIK